jgi:hypothetical protein
VFAVCVVNNLNVVVVVDTETVGRRARQQRCLASSDQLTSRCVNQQRVLRDESTTPLARYVHLQLIETSNTECALV